MSCAFSFLQFKEAKRSKSFVILFFALKEEKTEETMDYTYSFLQCKEAKPRKRCLMQILFFKLKKQNGGNHWLYRLKEGISVSHALLGFEYLN